MKFLAILFVLSLQRFANSTYAAHASHSAHLTTHDTTLSLFSAERHWAGRFVIACSLAVLVELVLMFLSDVAYGLPVLILQCLFLFYLVVQANPAAMLDQYVDYVKRGEWQTAYMHASGLLGVPCEAIDTEEALEKEVFAKYVIVMFNVFFLPFLMFWLLGTVGLIFAVLVFNFSDDCTRTPAVFKLLRRLLQYPLVFTYYLCGHSVAVWSVMSVKSSDNRLVAAATEAIGKDEKVTLNSITLLRKLHEKVILVWLVFMGVSVIFDVGSPLY